MRFAQVAAWAWLACLAAAPVASHAGGASAGFEIRVTLHNGAGIPGAGAPAPDANGRRGAICTSQTRGSDQTALVEVLCSVGPFVNIAPAPGQAIESSSGDPWRYDFGPQQPLRRAALAIGARSSLDIDSGTLTALQVTNASGDGSALEMLVSF